MVEKNIAYNRDARSEGFADNDPLAELARIVGFEDRPSHAGSEAAPRAASPATRREPEFKHPPRLEIGDREDLLLNRH